MLNIDNLKSSNAAAAAYMYENSYTCLTHDTTACTVAATTTTTATWKDGSQCLFSVILVQYNLIKQQSQRTTA